MAVYRDTVSTVETEFAQDIRRGLSSGKKSIPSKYLYDARGARIYERLVKLPEYYLVAAEEEILRHHGPDIARMCAAPELQVIELGSGGGAEKARMVLPSFFKSCDHLRYYPFDINQAALDTVADALPEYTVVPLRGDYSHGLNVIRTISRGRKAVLFLGSSIGNFEPDDAVRLLRRIARVLCPGDRCFIGFDIESDTEKIFRAYSDSSGITREFNLNLLHRINSELGGCFDPQTFVHAPRFNVDLWAMESFLVSRVRQAVRIELLDMLVQFEAGEAIYTECSYKFTLDRIADLSRRSGLLVLDHFGNHAGNFVITALESRTDC